MTMIGIIERMLRSEGAIILGFASAHRCVRICHMNSGTRNYDRAELESLASRLRLMLTSERSSKYDMEPVLVSFGKVFRS